MDPTRYCYYRTITIFIFIIDLAPLDSNIIVSSSSSSSSFGASWGVWCIVGRLAVLGSRNSQALVCIDTNQRGGRALVLQC